MTGSSRRTDHQFSPYRDRSIAVGTRHGKERQFRAAFRDVLGAVLVTPDDLDTDRFGTFSGELPRTTTAVEAARAKAHLAMTVTGLPAGIASEASYGTLGELGYAGHEEVLMFCDAERGIEVLTGHRTLEVPGYPHRVRDPDDVPAALRNGLPAQALIVRPAQALIARPAQALIARTTAAVSANGITKGIVDIPTLQAAITRAVAQSADRHAIVEPDLRAHHNPSRQRVLTRLADSLARRLATPCPACRTPGFGRVSTEPGLPCRGCGMPTSLPLNEIHGCPACDHQASRPVSGDHADPGNCPRCNP